MTGILSALIGAKVVPPFTAAAAPSSVVWNGPDMFGFYASDTITATPTGGTGPYTYAWETVSGDSFTGYDTAAASFVTVTGNPAVVKCLVTDSLGASAYTNNVSIS